MGLGGYPEVTLKDARRDARLAREKIRAGVDPIEEKKAARSALAAGELSTVTFEAAAKTYISAHEAGWANAKHRGQWESTLKRYAHPEIGTLAVGDIRLPHILKILEPIWVTKTETAKRLRGRIEVILDAAYTRGQIQGPWQNPARWRGHLDNLLPKPSRVSRVAHHPALSVSDVGSFMSRLRQQEGMGARALEFLILTAARSGEVRGATWSEVDLDQAVWTVPAERMKAGREHRVPLSADAVEVLKGLPRFGSQHLLFPSARGGQLSDMTVSAVTRRMKVSAVPHGFRSTFRDWAAERTGYPSDVAEMALAHTIPNKVEAAYRRGDLFHKRRRMMEDWAKFLSVEVSDDYAEPPIPIRGGARG
jgi:integrase